MIEHVSFATYGKASVGVPHQYCGAAGKRANCQVAISSR
ncbi:transposase [Streptomyces sp. CA-251251]